MARTRSNTGTIGGTARRTMNDPKTIALIRFGYATKGLVFAIIGWLAFLAALGVGGSTTDRKGVVTAIYEQPFGKVLLAIVVFGLICFAIWNFAMAGLDTEHKGNDPKGILRRISYAVIGFSYAGLAFAALQLVLGKGSTGKSSDQSTQDWTAKLLDQPFGVVLVIIVALVVFGVAGAQFYQAYTAKFQKHLDLSRASANSKKYTVIFGRIGMGARGFVFGIIGIFLVVAALNHDASKAKGLGGALQEVSQQPYGQFLLAVVGLGLLVYGIYCFFEARYRRIGRI